MNRDVFMLEDQSFDENGDSAGRESEIRCIGREVDREAMIAVVVVVVMVMGDRDFTANKDNSLSGVGDRGHVLLISFYFFCIVYSYLLRYFSAC